MDSHPTAGVTVTVTVGHDIDMASAGEVEVSILAAARNPHAEVIVVDLTSCFIDLRGYRALSRAQRAVREAGKELVIVGDSWQAEVSELIGPDVPLKLDVPR